MTELGPALVACLLAVSVAAAALRRVGLSARCLVLAAAVVLALTGPAGLDAVGVVVAAGAPLVAVLDPDRDRPWPTWVVCGALGAATALTLLATDPFLDPTCVIGCGANPLALGHLAAAPAVAAVLLAAASLATASEGVRRRSALTGVGAALTVSAILGVVPESWVLVAAVGIGLVRGAGAVLGAVEARARLADVAIALEQSQDPTASLQQLLDDPALSLAFVLPDGSVVDEVGGDVSSVPPGQQVDLVTVGESTVARVSHGPDTSSVAIAGAMSGGARVALDNARLLAVSRLNSRLLRESRARVVNGTDEERRLMERDLHDGAQQEVLSLGLALRDELTRSTEPHRRAALEEALVRTSVVLESLRELGHGLRPAGLDGGSLPIALEAIVDRARVPVDIVSLPADRLPRGVVSAIARLVASRSGAAEGPVRVEVTAVGDDVLTTIRGAGVAPTQPEVDRFATLGGELAWDGSTLCARLPGGGA